MVVSSVVIPASVGLVVLAAMVACSSSTPTTPATDPESCSVIAKRCHPYEEPLGVECHELGHAGDLAVCTRRQAECLAACPELPEDAGAADTSTPDAAGASDASKADAGPDPACVPYCECMNTTCSSSTGYPYDDNAACLAACNALTEEERTCYPKWCAKAADSSSPKHFCEHAWGALGTKECETL